MRKSAFLFLVLLSSFRLAAQGTLSGDLMMNLNFFQRDTNIHASGNPLYNSYLSGNEGWLGLRYNVKGFTFSLRVDAFNNSNLKNTTAGSTDFGIGAWSINKEMKDLSITVGYIYDQIGSGILFRAYEDRGLLIDNALVGIQLKYKVSDKISLKGFTGQQKNNSLVNLNSAVHTLPYGPVIKGINAEGDFAIGNVHIMPGAGILNRTLDDESYKSVVSTIKSQDTDHHFTPVYNMYAATLYNNLVYKNFSLYTEVVVKSHEAIFDDKFISDKPGNVEYISANYGRKGFALSLTGKRTEDFVMRVSPSQIGLDGKLNWQPVVDILRSERLMSRYTLPTQSISEQAATANLIISPNDVTNITCTYTSSNTLTDVKLFREVFADFLYQGAKKWVYHVGCQYREYNASRLLGRPENGAPIVYAVTPFTEITYKINERKSLRAEVQYMSSKQDYGSWAFALIEYNIAPKWSVSASDMYNIGINKNPDNPNSIYPGFANKSDHYFNFFAAYTKGANRFTLAYVKQTDGINCTGGVCRYEPAFSGLKAGITSSF